MRADVGLTEAVRALDRLSNPRAQHLRTHPQDTPRVEVRRLRVAPSTADRVLKWRCVRPGVGRGRAADGVGERRRRA